MKVEEDIQKRVENFRRNFLEVCTYRHISPTRLAKKMGATYQLVWSMKSGKQFNPRLSTIFTLSKVLKVPPQIFFDDWPGGK